MAQLKHWTSQSDGAFALAIATDFVGQIETALESAGMERRDLARAANVSSGRVSQVLNDPKSLNLRSIVKFARAIKKKPTIVLYDDNDPENEQGPITSTIFSICWEIAGKPKNMFELSGTNQTIYMSWSVHTPNAAPITVLNQEEQEYAEEIKQHIH